MRNKQTRRTVIKGLAAVGGVSALPGTRAWSQNSPIQIGFVGPLSGAQQIYGTNTKIAAEIARDEINAAGGIGGKMIELVSMDDKANANAAIAALRELTGKGVNLIVGPQQTGPNLATIPLLKDLNCVSIGTGSGDDRFTHDMYTPHFFQAAEANVTKYNAFAKVMANKYPNVTLWTGIIPNVSFGTEAWEGFSRELKKEYKLQHNKDITLEEPVVTKFGATDFRTQINSLQQFKAQGLYHLMIGADGLTFFQQASQADLFKKFTVVADNSYLEFELPKLLKDRMPSNVWSMSFWVPTANSSNPVSEKLYKEWVKRTNDPYPISISVFGHTGVHAFAEALKQTGGSTDTAKVIAALEAVKFNSAKGPISFRKEDHQVLTSTYVFRAAPASGASGWSLAESVTVDLASVNPPPTPGVALKAI